MNSVTATSPMSTEERNAQTRRMIDEVVGLTFFAPILKSAHNSVLKGKYGHGGRGEEVFQAHMDLELARSMGRGVRTSLAEALYRKLTRQA